MCASCCCWRGGGWHSRGAARRVSSAGACCSDAAAAHAAVLCGPSIGVLQRRRQRGQHLLHHDQPQRAALQVGRPWQSCWGVLLGSARFWAAGAAGVRSMHASALVLQEGAATACRLHQTMSTECRGSLRGPALCAGINCCWRKRAADPPDHLLPWPCPARLVKVDINAAGPPSTWQDVIPQHPRDLLQSVSALKGDNLLVEWLRDVSGEGGSGFRPRLA
jgi:hypothetical protein